MRFRSFDSNQDLMPEGEYEVYVKSCEETETRGGTPCIAFDFVVRSDIQQPYQNKHKFKNFYQDRDTGAWPKKKIGRWANALGIPKDQDFDLDDLVGRSAVMVIGHYQDEKTFETKDCIYYLKTSKQEPYISEPPKFSELPDSPEEDEDGGELPFK